MGFKPNQSFCREGVWFFGFCVCVCNPIALCMDLKNCLGKWECCSMFPVWLSPSLQTVNFPPTSCGNIAERKIASDFRFVDFSESLLEHLVINVIGKGGKVPRELKASQALVVSKYAKCQLNLTQSQRTQRTSILSFWTSILGFRILRSMQKNIGVIST